MRRYKHIERLYLVLEKSPLFYEQEKYANELFSLKDNDENKKRVIKSLLNIINEKNKALGNMLLV